MTFDLGGSAGAPIGTPGTWNLTVGPIEPLSSADGPPFPVTPPRPEVDVRLDELNVHELAALADAAEAFNEVLDNARDRRGLLTYSLGRRWSPRVRAAFETGLRQLGLTWTVESDQRDGDSLVISNPTGNEIPRYPVPTPDGVSQGLPGSNDVGPRSYRELSLEAHARDLLSERIREQLRAHPHDRVLRVRTRFDGVPPIRVEAILQELTDPNIVNPPWDVSARHDPGSGLYVIDLTRRNSQ